MTTAEERIKILQMIQEGKLSTQDGIALLELMAGQTRGPAGSPAAGAPTTAGTVSASGRWFRVRVTDTRTGKTRVNLRMPVSMVSAGMKMGARFAPQVQGLESATLMEMLKSGAVGKIVDVFDDDDSEHIEVYIE